MVEQPETQAPAQTVEPVSDAGAQVADVDFPLADAGTLGECAVVPLEHAAERGGHLGHFAGVRAVLEAVRNVVPGYGGLFSKVVVPKDVPENGEFSGRPTFPLVSSKFLFACAPHTWSGSLVRCASDGERYNDWLTQIGG